MVIKVLDWVQPLALQSPFTFSRHICHNVTNTTELLPQNIVTGVVESVGSIGKKQLSFCRGARTTADDFHGAARSAGWVL